MTKSRCMQSGFTLVELLVVITIILVVSVLTLPTLQSALANHQVTEAARGLQAAMVGARDQAVRDNAPAGIRLLVDPVFNGSTTTLAYNRLIPIETPGDYFTGRAAIVWPQGTNYTNYVEGPDPGGPHVHPALRVDESLIDPSTDPPSPNERASWFWNIRIGDKIRFNDSGRYYTVVGPMVVANSEMFVNDGLPGDPTRNPNTVQIGTTTLSPEYLYLVNGQDDDHDGFVDNGWDGFNNNYNHDSNNQPIIDEYDEWTETEQWVGTELATLTSNPGALQNIRYTILRRPTPGSGSREITLPGGVVIDATSWDASTGAERSRLPIDPKTLYFDILIGSNGQVMPTTAYSSPTASSGLPFYHFWLTERQDVHEMSDLWGVDASRAPNANPNSGSTFMLPLPASFYSGLLLQPPASLQGERILLTLFTRTGQIVSNSLENFSTTDINTTFYAAQSGAREAR